MTTAVATTLVMEARGLVKRYGHVTALDSADFELRAGEILAVIGDNGAGKVDADQGAVWRAHSRRGRDPARRQRGALSHADGCAPLPGSRQSTRTSRSRQRCRSPRTCFSAANCVGPACLGSVFRMLDKKRMYDESTAHMRELQIEIGSMGQAVETLSGRSATGCGGRAQRRIRASRRHHG